MRIKILVIMLMLLDAASFAQDKKTLAPSETEVLVKVTVTDVQNAPRKKDIVIFVGVKSKKRYQEFTDSLGKFSILLPKGDTYNIMYKDFTDSTDYSQIEIPTTAGKFTSELSIQIQPLKTYTLENVFFDTGLSTLKPESYKALNDLVEVMKFKSTFIIEIAGHTDNTGTVEINLKLSQDRANAVRNYLLKKGIAANRVTAKGYGDTETVADNTTSEGKANTRRTEVRIIKE